MNSNILTEIDDFSRALWDGKNPQIEVIIKILPVDSRDKAQYTLNSLRKIYEEARNDPEMELILYAMLQSMSYELGRELFVKPDLKR